MPMRCAACDAEVAAAQRFCGSCGSPMFPPSQTPTITRSSGSGAGAAPAAAPVAARIISSSPKGRAGFTPGTILAGRYRVIGLLGRGGMGEVYRADDLKLGQPVALKFLPRAIAADAARLDRFLAEVRIARQVSHPNVCRVYDIAVVEGEHFLSMEYIDGEDLASLLRRIGRLPPDKALDIARQICAGVAAAHDRGVLHRDLKPANIMLDGRGRVRITDFGLAVAADAAGLDGEAPGTPLYMSPEQLAGMPASVRSDIYALGLVLYELYTGKCAFSGASIAELRTRKEQDVPRAPSELIKDMDPAVDRLVLRAIAPDPAARPVSVAQVAAALPGSNLLAAVLRAGETPSPEMVAASGTKEGLPPLIAWGLVLLTVISSIIAASLASTGVLWRHAAPDKSPEVLADTAREMLAAFGYGERPADRASAFEMDLDHLRYLEAREPVHWRSMRPDPSLLRFWYRESPQPLEAWRFPYQYGNVSRITSIDPPLEIAGMSLVRLDPRGRLTQLIVVPASEPGPTDRTQQVDWTTFLHRAGFDASAWQPVAPARNPPVYADARAAWHATWPNTPDLPVRLEAGALAGRPVYFEAIFPWTTPARAPSPLLTSGERAAVLIGFSIIAVTMIGVAVFAQRNVRAGRGDRRGALRVSAFVFAAVFLSWLFGESHIATLWEVALVAMALAAALLAAGFSWLAYLAVEPFLRRRWPEVLVTWTRLLAGEFRDPLVGRDVLVGCAAAAVLAIVGILGFVVPEWLGLPSGVVFADVYGVAYGVRSVLPLLIWRAAQSVVAGLGAVFLLLLLRLVLRSQWLTVATFVLANALMASASDVSWVNFVSSLIHVGVFTLLIVRFGLLAAVVQFYVWGLFIFFPMTSDLTAWYAGAGVTAAFVLAALTLYGFTTSLAGRPVFGEAA